MLQQKPGGMLQHLADSDSWFLSSQTPSAVYLITGMPRSGAKGCMGLRRRSQIDRCRESFNQCPCSSKSFPSEPAASCSWLKYDMIAASASCLLDEAPKCNPRACLSWVCTEQFPPAVYEGTYLMYIYIYTHTYSCVYTNIHLQYTCMYMYIEMFILIHVYIHIHTCIHTCM